MSCRCNNKRSGACGNEGGITGKEETHTWRLKDAKQEIDKEYLNAIKETVASILHSLPSGVTIVTAAKTRSPDEVKSVTEAGIRIIGYNYIQEAECMRQIIDDSVQ
jgi:hypothetical protein